MFDLIIVLVIGYAIGSISCAVIISKALNLPDPRTQGSHNAGATNVMRIAGKKVAALVLIGDVCKGLIAVYLVKLLGFVPAQVAMAGVGAVFGHIFPVYFGFKGGKGVATAAGVILALSWKIAAILVAIWLIVLAIYRIVSLASIIAALAAPILAVLFGLDLFIYPLAGLTVIILFKHYDNISRLMDGIEPKLGEK